jgi:hypothetical protein
MPWARHLVGPAPASTARCHPRPPTAEGSRSGWAASRCRGSVMAAAEAGSRPRSSAAPPSSHLRGGTLARVTAGSTRLVHPSGFLSLIAAGARPDARSDQPDGLRCQVCTGGATAQRSDQVICEMQTGTESQPGARSVGHDEADQGCLLAARDSWASVVRGPWRCADWCARPYLSRGSARCVRPRPVSPPQRGARRGSSAATHASSFPRSSRWVSRPRVSRHRRELRRQVHLAP